MTAIAYWFISWLNLFFIAEVAAGSQLTSMRDGLLISPVGQTMPRLQTPDFLEDALSFRLAASMDSQKIEGNGSFPLWVGLKYQFAQRDLRHLELGVDWITDNEVFLSFYKKRIFYPDQRFRPFYSYGLSFAPNDSNQLAGLIDIESYFINGTLGFEDLLKSKTSFKIEIEFKLSWDRQIALLGIGYAWPNIF